MGPAAVAATPIRHAGSNGHGAHLPANGAAAANGKPAAGEAGGAKAADKRKDKKQAYKKAAKAAKAKSKNGEHTAPARPASDDTERVEVEFVPEQLPLELTDGAEKENEVYKELARVFAKFAAPTAESEAAEAEAAAAAAAAKAVGYNDEALGLGLGLGTAASTADIKDAAVAAAVAATEEGEGDGPPTSKRKAKLAARPKVAELKQLCPRPEVVEVWDVTAPDPKLLVWLKSYRNTVPVPRHWSQKRRFLQGKRGIEKPPWQLPAFIAATGIEKIRSSYVEKEDAKKLKTKQRQRMQPKMGRLDIDYQVLHDAFFKYQTKPKLTTMGEAYFEGKEYEVNMKDKRPGQLSDALKIALGMPTDAPAPPPWLVNMQRYGPPPSYPLLRIPGLNCPIPTTCTFGYQAGGWGKPPVDEFNRPLYGDVFGLGRAEDYNNPYLDHVDRSKHWGDMEVVPEVESEPEDDADAEDDAAGAAGADDTSEVAAGTASVMSTVPSGVETPDVLDLRKAAAGAAAPRPLYTVLPEQAASVTATQLMGSSHTYVVPSAAASAAAAAAGAAAGAAAAAAAARAGAASGAGRRVEHLGAGGRAAAAAGAATAREGVQLTLRPEDLESLESGDGAGGGALAARYAAQLAAERSAAAPEDFRDLVVEQAARAKRKATAKDGDKGGKKDFKF